MNSKSLIFSIVLICTGSTSILADEYQRGYSSSRTCTRNEYREEYIPGTRKNSGYVKKWEETVEVPCPGGVSTSNNNEFDNNEFDNNEFDNNDCSEGKIAGGILGAGFATAISRGKDRWWAIPAGLVGGSMVGCQIDGG